MVFAHLCDLLLLFLDAFEPFLVDVLAISLRLLDHRENTIDLAQDIGPTHMTRLLPLPRGWSRFYIILSLRGKGQKTLRVDGVFVVSKLNVPFAGIDFILFALASNQIVLLYHRHILL